MLLGRLGSLGIRKSTLGRSDDTAYFQIES